MNYYGEVVDANRLRQETAAWKAEAERAAIRALKAEAKLKEAREILFAYGNDNDGTAHPWWAVVKKNRMGAQAICAGPFFSRGRAEMHADAKTYDYGATVVWGFSGHNSEHYKKLREVLSIGECEGCEAPAVAHDVNGVPLCAECYREIGKETKALEVQG